MDPAATRAAWSPPCTALHQVTQSLQRAVTHVSDMHCVVGEIASGAAICNDTALSSSLD